MGGCQPQGSRVGLIAYLRTSTDRRLLVVVNLGAHSQTYELGGRGSGRVLLSTSLDTKEERLSDPLTLRGHEGLLLALG